MQSYRLPHDLANPHSLVQMRFGVRERESGQSLEHCHFMTIPLPSYLSVSGTNYFRRKDGTMSLIGENVTLEKGQSS